VLFEKNSDKMQKEEKRAKKMRMQGDLHSHFSV
jgi:hypothetical protein